MAVVFDIPGTDNATATGSASATTLTTPAGTISSSANRAGLLGLSFQSNTPSSITGNIGGAGFPATLITGTDSGTTTSGRTLQFGVTAPPSGSQTATMSWTTAVGCTLAFVTATGVDQTTPFNNGTFATGSGNPSLAITSTNGALTVDTTCAIGGTLSSPNQTEKWNDSASNFGAGSIGPGTGTTTHTWVLSGSSNWPQSGCNFNQAVVSAPDPIGSANITSSAGRFIGWTT